MGFRKIRKRLHFQKRPLSVRATLLAILVLSLYGLTFLGDRPPKLVSTEEADRRREFGSQVARDVAVWMVLAFATAQTDLGPYLIYAGGFSVAFAVCYQIYLAKKP
ncbi:unnamed protein product [Cladocopium goreaui]|uniref:Uncharacterized protein n=1 Tax=Cladocopium goreaui TaxID=2562237 RepID=A0A9P1G7L1_9DINO|nr:unnamed protein product [Cladocopium goreaui]CAI4012455.1 unnamed protein product [Cladocopium goreaui]